MKVRKALFIFFLSLLVLLLGTWLILRTTGAGRAIVRQVLSKVLKGRFGMGKADVDLLGGTVEIKDFNLRDPDRPRKQFLTVRKVLVGISRNPLDPGAMDQVTLTGIALHLRLGAKEAPDLSKIVDLASQKGSGADLPPVRVEDSICYLYLPGAKKPTWTLDKISLSLEPGESRGGTRAYSIKGRIALPLGGGLNLQGVLTVPRRGSPAIRLKASWEGIRLEPGTRLGFPLVDEFLARIRPRGKADLQLWMQYPDARGKLRGGLRLALKGMDFTPPVVPYRVTGFQGTLEARTDQGGTFLADISSQTTRASFKVKGKVVRPGGPGASWDLFLQAKDVALDTAMEKALLASKLEDPARAWRAFEPRGGRADARILLKSPPGGGPPAATVDLSVRDSRAAFLGFPPSHGERTASFPYPLDHVSGKVRILPGGLVVLRDIQARAGGGKVSLGGEVLVPPGGKKGRIRLVIQAEGVPFGKDLERALAAAFPKGEKLYRDYAPRGRFDARVVVRRKGGEDKIRIETTLTPRGASAAFRLFPYRIEDLTGTVAILPEGVSFDIQGGRGAPLVEVHGRFPFGEGPPTERMELTVSARDVPIDDKLRKAMEAMAPSSKKLWKVLSPRGTADMEVAAAGRPGGSGPVFYVTLSLKDGSFTYSGFPVPVTRAGGKVFVTVSPRIIHTDILGIHGFAWGSPVSVYGTLEGERNSDLPSAMDVIVVSRKVRITQRLGSLLNDYGFLRREVFDLLSARGTVDLVQHLERAKGETRIRGSSEIQLLGVESDCRLLPDKATGVVGTVLAFPEGMDILWMEGLLGKARVAVPRGKVRLGKEETTVEVRVTSENFPVDDRLARLMDAPVDRIYLERKARGALRLVPLDLFFRVPRGGGPLKIRFSGHFEALGGKAVLGVPVEGIKGPFSILEGRLEGGKAYVRGNLEGMTMKVLGIPLEGITASLESTEKSLRILEGRAGLAGGEVTGYKKGRDVFTFGYSEPHAVTMNIRFSGIRIKRLLSAFGPSPAPYRGSLSGNLEAEIPDLDPRDMKARLRLVAKEAFIGKVPLLDDLYRLLTKKRSPSFQEGKLVIRVHDGKAIFQEITLRSNFFDVKGTGVFDLDKGFDFHFKAGNLGTFMLNPILGYRMRGTLRDYNITLESPILPVGGSPPPTFPVLPDLSGLPERALAVDGKEGKKGD